MKKLIKNNTIHLIHLKKANIYSFEQKEIEITELELEKFKDKISVISASSEVPKQILKQVPKQVPEQVPEQVPKEEIKKGIINKHILDNYLGKNTRGILNDLEEDKEHFSDDDLRLLSEYELSHKNREIVLEKIKKLRGE